MNHKTQIAELHEMAKLVLDVKLGAVRAAARAREASLQRLADLEAPETTATDMVQEALAMQRYQQWADLRRAEINRGLARQTAEWLEARDSAREAFGRAEAVAMLRARLR
jgi:hypothetical protein